MVYLILKVIHIASATIFLGNIITGIFWKEHADRTRDARLIAHALEGIIGSDRRFTIPGVIGITIGGFGAAALGHLPMLRTGWILWGIVLFSVSGVAFMAQVAPLQRKMAKLMRDGAASGAPDWAAYGRLSRDWNLWGLIALIAPAIALVIMVLKPALPAF
ncbi:MAG: DUF2269 domain-containing protein [Candidatus Eisenbacteria bacterium]|nr:DUF2269 domain-containing protein [Candidatus Eisenbacteria bacterium]